MSASPGALVVNRTGAGCDVGTAWEGKCSSRQSTYRELGRGARDNCNQGCIRRAEE